MTVILNLTPEVEAGLMAHAQVAGMTPEDYLQPWSKKTSPPMLSKVGRLKKAAWFGKMGCSSTALAVPFLLASLTMWFKVLAMKDRGIFWAATVEAVFR